MKVRKFVNDKDSLRAAGIQFIQSSRDVKSGYRAAIVNLALGGIPKKELSLSCGESVGTINNWIKRADIYGFESLALSSPPGRKSRLTDEQYSVIREAVLAPPEEYGFNVWDGKAVSAFIEREFNVSLGVRQCQNILKKKLGLSLIRPQTLPSKGNENQEDLMKERELFKKKILEVSNDPNKILVFQDEAHFHQTTTVARLWAPKGSKPQVASAPSRKSVAISGYVFPESGKLIVTKPTWFNFETVIQSLREFMSVVNIPFNTKIALVLDNAPWHKKAYRLIVEEELPEYADIRQKIELIRLPPYSPDLNPIEQCWRKARREVTHNRYFKSLDDLAYSLFSYFATFKSGSEMLSSLCKFSWFSSC